MHRELVNISFCGNYNSNKDEQGQTCEDSECKEYTLLFDNLDNTKGLLLHWHSKLHHIGFNQMKDSTKRGYLPKILNRARSVKCLACQQGKAHMTASETTSNIVKGIIHRVVGYGVCERLRREY